MTKVIDLATVADHLEQESLEWNEKASHVKDATYRSYLHGIASGYLAAATYIAAMTKKQTEGNVLTDSLNDTNTSEI